MSRFDRLITQFLNSRFAPQIVLTGILLFTAGIITVIAVNSLK